MSSTLVSGKPIRALPWSWSSLASFESCPRRHYAIKSKQAFEHQDDGLKEGNAQHTALDKAVSGEAALPVKYQRYIPIVNAIKTARGQKVTEQDFAITASFKPTDYWGPDAWYRGKQDLQIIRPTNALAFDYKTGKVKSDKDKFSGQLALTAAVTFAQHAAVETVTTAYIWLAHDKITPEHYTRADISVIWQEFLPRIKRLTHAADTHTFEPKPSGLCREYCPLRQSQCEFSGRP